MRITKSQIKRIMMEAIKEASEFGDMKTGNTYTYKNDGYTYIVIDDMWHVIKGKKKKADSIKDYISLEGNGTALNRLDKEHPEARQNKKPRKSLNKSFDDIKKDIERDDAISKKEKQIIDNSCKDITSYVSDVKKILATPTRGRSFVFMVDRDNKKGSDLLKAINNDLVSIEKHCKSKDIAKLTALRSSLNKHISVIDKKVTATPIDAKKLSNLLKTLAQSIATLDEYVPKASKGQSNVAASSDFEFKPSADSIEVVKETVYRKLRRVLSEQFLDNTPSSGFDMEADSNFNAATGKGNYKSPEDDFEFKPSADSIEVVDTGKGDSSKAASKPKKSNIVAMIQKIIDPQAKLTKADGQWGKNTQKAWEQYVKSEEFKEAVLDAYSGSDKEQKVKGVIDALPKKATAVKELGFEASQKGVLEFIQKAANQIKNKATGEEVDEVMVDFESDMQARNQDKGFVKRQIEKIKKKKGGKFDKPTLNKINNILKKNKQHLVDEFGEPLEDPRENLDEGLSRGSLYRRRYHGRY